MIALGITAIVHSAIEDRAARMICISWNAWLFEVGLHHCMAWCNELKYNNVTGFSGQIIGMEFVHVITDYDGLI